MERGWNAAGLLRPLWRSYPGGRDGLAAAVGTTGSVLSGINTGRRPLGTNLGRRLADALNVTLLELGCPQAMDESERALTLLDRLEELSDQVALIATDLARIERTQGRMIRQLRPVLGTLEQPAGQPSQPRAPRKKRM